MSITKLLSWYENCKINGPTPNAEEIVKRAYFLMTEEAKERKEGECGLREELSELEHDQWVKIRKATFKKAKEIDGGYFIQKLQANVWKEMFKPYSELSEELKDYDREWADKVLAIVRKHSPSAQTISDLKAKLEAAEKEMPIVCHACDYSSGCPDEWCEQYEEMEGGNFGPVCVLKNRPGKTPQNMAIKLEAAESRAKEATEKLEGLVNELKRYSERNCGLGAVHSYHICKDMTEIISKHTPDKSANTGTKEEGK